MGDVSLLSGVCQFAADSYCAYHACLIEVTYVTKVAEMIIRDAEAGQTNDWDSSENRHENGFDPMSGCAILPGTQSDKECCGVHPFRFPYKTLMKKCCDGAVHSIGVMPDSRASKLVNYLCFVML